MAGCLFKMAGHGGMTPRAFVSLFLLSVSPNSLRKRAAGSPRGWCHGPLFTMVVLRGLGPGRR